MGMGGGQSQAGFDANAAYTQEREMLAAYKQESELDKVERRILGERYPDPSSASASQIDLSRYAHIYQFYLF